MDIKKLLFTFNLSFTYSWARAISRFFAPVRRLIQRNVFLSSIFGMDYFKLLSSKSFVNIKESIRGKGNILNVGRRSFLDNIELVIIGNNNSIEIGDKCKMVDGIIYIKGNNNKISIGTLCNLGISCCFRIEGQHCAIIFGDKSTMSEKNEIVSAENNGKVIIGSDTMISNHVQIRNTDAHSILDISTRKRINPPADVHIGNHVWIAPDTKIMKGATIHDGSIIGSNTFVGKEIPSNCLAVGYPAVVIRRGVEWNRDLQ